MQGTAQAPLDMRQQGIGAHRLAGFGAAHPHHAAPGRLRAEVVVVGDHAVDLGARQVQRTRNLGHRLCGHAAQRILHVMQDRQQSARLAGQAVQDVAHDGQRR